MSDLTIERRRDPGAPIDKNLIAGLLTGLIAFCVLAGGLHSCETRERDNEKTIVVECLKAGKDPLLCREAAR